MAANQNAIKEYGNQILIDKSGKKLYLDPETADVYFVFCSDDDSCTRVPAHKNLLAATSDVFKAMFYGSLKEEGDVHVKDVTAAAFEEFLQFFYLNTIKMSAENVAGVMYLGHMYNVAECFKRCVQFVMNTLTDDNVCTGLGLAIRYDQTELIRNCEKRILISTDVVFESASFLDCDKQVLKHILKMDSLSCSEAKVFEACMSWVKSVSKEDVLDKEIVRSHLGGLFYDIRFASMTVEEFAILANMHKSLFTSNEYIDIVQMIAIPDFQPQIFSKKPRQMEWNGDDAIICNRCVSVASTAGSYNLLLTEITTFSTTQPVLLGSFECAKLCIYRDKKHCDLRANIPIEVHINEVFDLKRETKNISKILCKQNATIGSESDTTITLNKPILIRPGFFYEIRVAQFPDVHCIYKRELKKEVQIDDDISIKFYHDRSGDNRITIGLINSMSFNRV